MDAGRRPGLPAATLRLTPRNRGPSPHSFDPTNRNRLFFTTTLDRVKGRSIARDPRCGLTVVNPHEPWPFVNIEGGVVIHSDNPVELRQLIVDLVDHPDYPWSRDEVEPMIVAPRRAIFELVPNRVSGVVLAPR